MPFPQTDLRLRSIFGREGDEALAALGLQRPSQPVAEGPTARPATTNDAAEELLNHPGETAIGEDDRRG